MEIPFIQTQDNLASNVQTSHQFQNIIIFNVAIIIYFCIHLQHNEKYEKVLIMIGFWWVENTINDQTLNHQISKERQERNFFHPAFSCQPPFSFNYIPPPCPSLNYFLTLSFSFPHVHIVDVIVLQFCSWQ